MNRLLAKKSRSKMVFDGDHHADSLMIGNYGDVEILAKGSFNLSGMIYSKSTVELTVVGNGKITFHGYCKKLIIHLAKGDCTLDLSKLSTREVICISLRDKSKTMIGPTKVITRANVQDEAIFQYSSKPLLQDYSIVGNAKIESIAA
jgi:hypothetical protein